MVSKKAIFFSLIIIVGITALVLSPVIYNKFVWDDMEYIVRNETLAKPLPEAIAYYFAQNYFVGNYHPLTMIAFSMEYHHAKLNPEFYHLVNLIIHLLNVVLVFWFIFLLSNRNAWVAAAVSLLFGIHPLHVESVAWISELKDVLYTFFYLFGLIVYLKFLDKNGRFRFLFYVSCFVFFVFSLLSKPAAVSFPLTLLAIDFYNQRKFNGPLIMEKIPFFAASVVFGLITLKAQGSAVSTLEQFSFLERIMLSGYAFIQYIIKLVLPLNLSAFHPFPSRIDGQFPWLFMLAPVAVALLVFLLYKRFRLNKLVIFGFLFFVANIILVLQFITVGMTVISERYTYVPYIGLFFVIAMYLYDYINNKAISTTIKNASLGIAVCILCVFAGVSFARTKVWKSEKTLWSDVIRKYPTCATAHYNLGTHYFKEEKNDAKALVSYNQTIKYDTTYIKAFVNRGIIYTRMKEFAKAESDFSRAIALDPEFSETYKNYGVLHNYMGNFDKAVEVYAKYLKLEPKSHDIFYGRGMTLYQLKRYSESIADFDNAIELDPKNSQYWILKSMCHHELGQREEAIKAAIKAEEYGEVMEPMYKQALGL